MNVLGLIAVLVIVGLVFSGICLAAELTDSLTQASAQNELNTVTSFTADDNLNVRITNVDATKFQAYFAYKGKTSMNPIASGLVNAGATRNINSIFIMAVAAWESGWGTSNYAAARHNYFGYGALYSNPDNAWAFNSADECVDVVASRIKADYLLDVSYGTYTVLTPTGQIYNPDTSQYHNGPPYTEEVRTTGAHYNEATLRGWIVDWNLNSQSELSGVLSIMNDFVSWHVQTYGVGVEINDSAIPVSNGFDYPVGDTGYVTEANDGDGWYNAQDFGVNNHLGEDWNGESGGDTDCGKPVYAVSKGTIVYAEDAGSGWGNVIIVRHPLPDGTQVESLYGHLQSMSKTSGTVERREQIGTIGKDGWPSCHLHFELRLSNCRAWGSPGPGYSTDASGWTDSSNFIDSHRQLGIIPLTADLNGNGTDTTGSYNTSTAEFTFASKTVRFGTTTDLPITGDWDGDGYDELGVYRPKVEGVEQSTFYLVTRNWADLFYEVGAADKTIPFGYLPERYTACGRLGRGR